MRDLHTITALTRRFGITPRTLRYYEQLGLIESIRPEDYAYRTYDEANMTRLGQIVLLRKLRIPLRQIAELLRSDDTLRAMDTFERHAQELGDEIDALSTLRSILQTLIFRLRQIQTLRLQEHLSDDAIWSLIQTAPDDKSKRKEVRTMNDVNQADATLHKLRDVRIVYLPPATVAASHFIGGEPENVAGERIFRFARSVDITRRKPDVRLYGFNHPNPADASNAHGYEFWLTIPEDLTVPEPLQKKWFPGGLYAAHMIRMGDFHEWAWLEEWVRTNGEYAYRGNGSPENMFDSLEEHLNAYTHLQGEMDSDYAQLDLMIPVRKA
ncbi:MAG: effector binding domain-containing protein [Firmicutes bacterium]|nr:effector binding domain-containing protein [Bacillota bacterium]